MRIPSAILLLLVLSVETFAQPDAAVVRRDQERAATAAAVRGLKEAAAREMVSPGVTIGNLLDRTKGHETLTQVLSRAEKIGGTRWIDDQTCQVRLEISGARVAQALVQIAATQPKKTPVAADVLAVKLRDWNARTFSATGSSTGAAEIEHARPEGRAWANVSDEARRAAVAAAKDDAINRAIESVRDVKLPDGTVAGDALKDPATRERIAAWLAARPVTQVAFSDDLTVVVQLAAPAAEFAEAFQDALRAGESQAGAWNDLRAEVERRFASPSGAASIGGAPVKPALQLPTLPPVWTSRQIEAQGSATAGGSKLKCARLAEAEAAKHFVTQIEQLALSDTQTIGQAAEANPAVRDAVARATANGRTYKVEYDSAGGARVWVQLDLHHVWNELRSVR